jgi:tRNA dimethylallyltransferase
VTIGGGVPFSAAGPGVGRYAATERFALVGVWLPRAALGERIDARVSRMVAAGLVEEVRSLAAGPGGMGRTARQALGYKEVLAHLEGGMALPDCVAEITRRTRAFARRQRSWFRRDPRIRWHGTAVEPGRLLPGLLAELDACGT